jgi:hypothetical protein
MYGSFGGHRRQPPDGDREGGRDAEEGGKSFDWDWLPASILILLMVALAVLAVKRKRQVQEQTWPVVWARTKDDEEEGARMARIEARIGAVERSNMSQRDKKRVTSRIRRGLDENEAAPSLTAPLRLSYRMDAVDDPKIQNKARVVVVGTPSRIDGLALIGANGGVLVFRPLPVDDPVPPIRGTRVETPPVTYGDASITHHVWNAPAVDWDTADAVSIERAVLSHPSPHRLFLLFWGDGGKMVSEGPNDIFNDRSDELRAMVIGMSDSVDKVQVVFPPGSVYDEHHEYMGFTRPRPHIEGFTDCDHDYHATCHEGRMQHKLSCEQFWSRNPGRTREELFDSEGFVERGAPLLTLIRPRNSP